LDVYTQAVTPAKHAAQAAVMSLVFSSDKSGGALPRKTRLTHLESLNLSNEFFIPMGGPQAHANSVESRA
jgi:hypothetical protein